MGETHDFMSLDWIQADIEQSLQCAQDALESFLTDRERLHLQASFDALRRVHESLQGANVPGALLLVEQVEALFTALLNDKVEISDDACAALAQALIYLPPYLDQVRSSEHDSLALLYTVINDLRKVLGDSPITEEALFNPDLGASRPAATKEAKQRVDAVDQAELRKFRQIYQFALIGLIRHEDAKVNFGRISNVIARLRHLCQGTPIDPLWEISAAFVEGLLHEGIALDAVSIELLRSVDKEIKEFIKAGVFGLDHQADAKLLKSMLYYVAKSSQAAPHIQSVRQAYSLDSYQLGDAYNNKTSPLVGPDQETFKSVIGVLTEELVRIKDTVDLYVRNTAQQTLDLDKLLPALKQISSTLVMLNLEAPRLAIQEQIDTLGDQLAAGSDISDDMLLPIAEAILYVEAELESLSGSIRRHKQESAGALVVAATEVVTAESLANLKIAQEVIGTFIASEEDFSLLETVPYTLRSAYGGLSMLSLNTQAQLVLSVLHYVEDAIIAQQKTPDGESVELLTAVMEAVGFSLQSLIAGQMVPVNRLDQAGLDIASLGYPITQIAAISGEGTELGDGFNSAYKPLTERSDIQPDPSPEAELESAIEQQAGLENTLEASDIAATAAHFDAATADVVEEAEILATDVSEQQVSDDELTIDEEILEIFEEEALEVFAAIDEQWSSYVQETANTQALLDTRRAFHTLKGSGRMVKAELLSELAWSIENMLNRLIEGDLAINSSICEVVKEVRPVLPVLLKHFIDSTQADADIDVATWIARVNSLAAGETPSVENLQTESVSLLESTELALTESEAADLAAQSSDITLTALADDNESFNDIFTRETEQHLATIKAFIDSARDAEEPILPSHDFYRAVHTLKGSPHMASLDIFSRIIGPLETLVLMMRNLSVPVNDAALRLLTNAYQLMLHSVGFVADDASAEATAEATDSVALIADVEQMLAELELIDTAANGAAAHAFSPDNINSVCALSEAYHDWRRDPQANSDSLQQMQTVCGQLNGAISKLGLTPLQAILNALTGIYGQLLTQQLPVDDRVLSHLDDADDGLIAIFDQLAAGEDIMDSAELVERLLALSETAQMTVALVEPATMENVEQPGESDRQVDAVPAQTPAVTRIVEPQDHELIDILLEEAEEILEHIAAAKQTWIENSKDSSALDELLRGLHTLKGSSRMAGVSEIGDLSHELESLYERIAAGTLIVSQKVHDLLHECEDRLMDMLTELKAQYQCSSAEDLITKVQLFRSDSGRDAAEQALMTATLEEEGTFLETAGLLIKQLTATSRLATQGGADCELLHAAIRSNLEQFQHKAYQASIHEAGDLSHIFIEVLESIAPADLPQESVQTDLADWIERINTSYLEAKEASSSQYSAAQQADSMAGQQADRKSNQDNVRVPAVLLEQLVDLAGETSVSRARIEQQVSNYGYSIDEVDTTIKRLREQLRRLENETETQILFRQEREGPVHQSFDPLEMDRYSRMQELSRSLMESVSDLFDLKDTLQHQMRFTEDLLLQQARVNTELHEGLMTARMVPFSRLVPRLRRLARQVGQELNKPVELTFINAETELDLSLLENMTAPLDHMLRNGLDHGIEPAPERLAAGKTEQGNITLKLRRDGGDIVLELRDDGAGIDVDRVRSKAIERGLMTADTKLTDHEVLQFILQAGFSTAKVVTQISGRGVGMNVAYSEIRRLGGSISIESELGKGTCFTVRLPFTVSISRSLMVNVGDDVYALPLNGIEGVVRINPYELEEYYREDGPDFEYAGVRYDLHYLGDYLGKQQAYQLQNGVSPLPVILVRTNDHAIAIQVDSISGSREVVVKPLGPQFSSLPGMSGATIMGDGRVVLILDMAAMIREQVAKEGVERVEPVIEATVSERLRVMVVDDSVTVRKVASRLLERHGLEVILAKDGVEAMTKLQDVVPNVLLLDIEMPRMDGFELASLVRHDEKLCDVPIVMISSRTGEKHRAHAAEIGVNQFMGKPFQEADLLGAITELTGYQFEGLKAKAIA